MSESVFPHISDMPYLFDTPRICERTHVRDFTRSPRPTWFVGIVLRLYAVTSHLDVHKQHTHKQHARTHTLSLFLSLSLSVSLSVSLSLPNTHTHCHKISTRRLLQSETLLRMPCVHAYTHAHVCICTYVRDYYLGVNSYVRTTHIDSLRRHKHLHTFANVRTYVTIVYASSVIVMCVGHT